MAVPWPVLTLRRQTPQRLSFEKRREFLRREKEEGDWDLGEGGGVLDLSFNGVSSMAVLHWRVGVLGVWGLEFEGEDEEEEEKNVNFEKPSLGLRFEEWFGVLFGSGSLGMEVQKTFRHPVTIVNGGFSLFSLKTGDFYGWKDDKSFIMNFFCTWFSSAGLQVCALFWCMSIGSKRWEKEDEFIKGRCRFSGY